MTDFGVGLCIGFIAGIVCTLVSAFIVAESTDHKYLDYLVDETEDDVWPDEK